jgi:uncharacterized membrane protein YbhN (UPF0104 family)
MAVGRTAKAVSIAVAVGLAIVLLFYSLRGIDWREVAHIVAAAEPARLAATAALATGTLFLRAWRWRILLNAEGSVGIGTTFWATAAGYFGNSFLPARAGELVRTFMISAQSGLDSAYVLATALSERVADAIALVIVGATVLLALPINAAWLAGAARPFALAALAGALGIAFLPLFGPQLRTVLERAPLPDAWRVSLIAMAGHALRGMRAFHDGRRLTGFVALTVLIWSLDAFAVTVTAAALGLSMPFAVALLLIASLGLGSALPSTPGYVGIYQFVAVTVLGPFGFSRTDAIAYILVAQAIGYVVIGIWGSIGILRYRRVSAGPAASTPVRTS